MASDASSFLMIFRESTPEIYEAMSREERREALDAWNAWCDRIAADGRLRAGNTLADVGRVVTGAGEPRVMDGPFAETKEIVAGYLLVSAGSLDEATAIARQCPTLPFGMVVEVRPVAAACHLARSLGWASMREPAAEHG